MPSLKRLANIVRYGLGPEALEKKRAAKAAARRTRFESELWQKEGELARRRYGSYEEYLAHQAAKLEQIGERLEETEAEDLAEFKRRFAQCTALEGMRNVLCLGARLGTEIKALHELGHFAVGIDLNPGPANPYVLYGDFHAIVFPAGSLDAIYTNALDHAFDLGRILGEVRRLLRPGGVFVADVLAGYEEGFSPGAYEAISWKDAQSFIARIAQEGGLALESVTELGRHRRDRWTQAVFRKPG